MEHIRPQELRPGPRAVPSPPLLSAQEKGNVAKACKLTPPVGARRSPHLLSAFCPPMCKRACSRMSGTWCSIMLYLGSRARTKARGTTWHERSLAVASRLSSAKVLLGLQHSCALQHFLHPAKRIKGDICVAVGVSWLPCPLALNMVRGSTQSLRCEHEESMTPSGDQPTGMYPITDCKQMS